MKIKKPIPIRRNAREWVLCLLYQWDIGRRNELTKEVLEDFQIQVSGFESREQKKILKTTVKTYQGILANIRTVDKAIVENSHNWSLERMAFVDRNVMRIAAYEILFEEEIPPAVSINEAIEIAKLYGSEDSGRFVNGILDKLNKEIKSMEKIGT